MPFDAAVLTAPDTIVDRLDSRSSTVLRGQRSEPIGFVRLRARQQSLFAGCDAARHLEVLDANRAIVNYSK